MHEAHPHLPAASLAALAISRSFGARRVLDRVTLERREPGVIGLLGPNGVGKTTLLRIVAQLTAPDGGELHVCGRRVEHGDDAAARRLVGWAPHEPLAWRDETVERNLRYAARLAGASKARSKAIATAAIALWALEEVAGEPVRLLSRGWAQRYSLARGDLLGPPVLLLDEPTTGLDDSARAMLETAVDAWRRERIVVIASHERSWLTERSDQLLELEAHA